MLRCDPIFPIGILLKCIYGLVELLVGRRRNRTPIEEVVVPAALGAGHKCILLNYMTPNMTLSYLPNLPELN
jgi:hypothetical protein